MPRWLHAYLSSGAVDDAAVAAAAGLLRNGELVAIPTETVYGLAANATDAQAVRRIFTAKGRPSFNPLIVHVLGVPEARRLASNWPALADQLAEAFWPGPLSIVVPRGPSIPLEVTAGLESVALRAPSHPIARAVLERSGLALAAPSANRSNAVSPTRAEHVVSSLGDRLAAVLDGGPCGVGIESTVVDVTGAEPVILRPGGISAAEISRVVGVLGSIRTPEGATPRASPGMMERHYSPDADTQLFRPDDLDAVLHRLPQAARIGVLALNCLRSPDVRITAWEQLGRDPKAYARDLYAALHRLEAAGVTHVLVERVPDSAGWDAVRDRLRRAAAEPGDDRIS